MTVQTSNTRVVFDGDGESTSFPFGFRILEGEHVDVFLTNPTGSTVQGINPNQVRKLQASEFSVTINEPQPGMGEPGVQETPGGTVRLDGFGAPATGLEVSVERATPLTQLTDYVPNDPFPADTHERALDKLTVIVQELKREINDTLISAPPGEDPNCPPLPIASERANKFLKFNSAGCPTVTDLDLDGDVVAPTVLSDLDNVAASNASDRQVISLNATTGDWTAEDNVFSINDVHGDITISTNSDGDIVINNDKGDTTTIDTTQVRGSKLLSTFTAAEAIDRGEFVSLRSNGQAELLKEVITSGGPAQTTEIVNNDGVAADAVHIPGTNRTVLLYSDATDNTVVNVIIFEIDPVAQEVSQTGSAQSIVSFTNTWDPASARLGYDNVNERLLIFVADPDNTEQPSVIAAEPDFNNLSITSTGSLTAASTSSEVSGFDTSGIGFHEGEETFVIGYQEDNNDVNSSFDGEVFFGAQIDPSNNSVSVGTPVAGSTQDANMRVSANIDYSPSNGVMVANLASEGAEVYIISINVSGTSLTLGDDEKIFAGAGSSITAGGWAENLSLGFAIYYEDDDQDGVHNIHGVTYSLTGSTITVEDNRVLKTGFSVEPSQEQAFAAYDAANNRWIIGNPDPSAAQVNDSDAAIITGAIDPSVPKLTFLEGTNSSGTTTLSTVDGDVNTNTQTPTIFEANAGLAMQLYRDNSADSLNVSLGTAPNSSSNRNRWIGTADEDVTAGNEFAVAMRSSDTFVKASSSLSPGTIYFLGPNGSLGSSSGDFRAGLATSTDTLLTAGVDFRDEGGTDDGSTSSTSGVSTEELIETREITSATNTIDVTLPPDFVQYRIELLEVQSDSADTDNDNLIVRFSNDGGSSFISSSNYKWLSSITTFTSGQFQNGNTGTTAGEHAPPAPNTSGLANHYTFWVLGARNPNIYSTVKSEEISTGGGGTGYTEGHDVLEIAEDHDALRFKVKNSVNITSAIVRVVGTK